MKRHLTRTLLAGAAVMLAMTGAQARMTRDQVRAELADARASGMLDVPGEIGATEAVLEARAAHNALETLVLRARVAMDEQLASATESTGQADLAVYFEAGPKGPVMVLLMFDGNGDLHSADSLALTLAAAL